MTITFMTYPLARRLACFALAATTLTACGVDKQTAPSFIGPSEFGLSISMTASPDVLPRDGSSQSVVTLTVRNERSQPVIGQRLSLAATAGTLSQVEVVTDASGRATFSVVAPPANIPVTDNALVVQVVPASGNFDNASSRTFSIALSGMSNTTAPTAGFNFSPAGPVLLQNVVFDASTSTDEGATCRDACTYAWDFGGEATASGRIVTYQFRSVRTYPVKLTVTDAAGSSGTLTQNVAVGQGTAPTAAFTFSPSSPGQFDTVNFTAEASRVGETGRTIASYSWRFGDGGTASGVSVTHSYSVLGTYPVTLTVTDSAGVQGTVTQNVTIVNGVTANFTISPSPSNTLADTIFDAEGSQGSDTGFGTRSQIVRYIWNFGDSAAIEETTSRVIAHRYTRTGSFTINLTVVDSAGRRATISRTLTVS